MNKQTYWLLIRRKGRRKLERAVLDGQPVSFSNEKRAMSVAEWVLETKPDVAAVHVRRRGRHGEAIYENIVTPD